MCMALPLLPVPLDNMAASLDGIRVHVTEEGIADSTANKLCRLFDYIQSQWLTRKCVISAWPHFFPNPLKITGYNNC